MTLQVRVLSESEIKPGEPCLAVAIDGKTVPAVLEDLHNFDTEVVRRVPIVLPTEPER